MRRLPSLKRHQRRYILDHVLNLSEMSKRTITKTAQIRFNGHELRSARDSRSFDRSVTWSTPTVQPPPKQQQSPQFGAAIRNAILSPLNATSDPEFQDLSDSNPTTASFFPLQKGCPTSSNPSITYRENPLSKLASVMYVPPVRNLFVKRAHRRFLGMGWLCVLLLNILVIGMTTAYVVKTVTSDSHRSEHPNPVEHASVRQVQDRPQSASDDSDPVSASNLQNSQIETIDLQLKQGTDRADTNLQLESSEQAVTNNKPDASPKEPSAMRNRLDWDSEPLPEFCRQIINSPQPNRKNCSTAPPVPGTPKCNPEIPMMYSQYGEDYFLYTRHFKHTMKKPGVYLDVATNDAIGISNTYFMDRCLGWKGICVEGNSKYYERIHRERSCALVPTCVSARDGEKVDFAMSGPGGGIVSTHRQGSEKIVSQAKRVEVKRCVTTMNQIKRFGASTIDYFNLDVEGGELNVLKSIDWDNVLIKIISVEIAPRSEQEIHQFLIDRNFIKIDNEQPVGDIPGMPIYPSNRFYAHKSVTFGSVH